MKNGFFSPHFIMIKYYLTAHYILGEKQTKINLIIIRHGYWHLQKEVLGNYTLAFLQLKHPNFLSVSQLGATWSQAWVHIVKISNPMNLLHERSFRAKEQREGQVCSIWDFCGFLLHKRELTPSRLLPSNE